MGISKSKSVEPQKPSSTRALVVCDFDGTVCTVDMGNALLNRFTSSGWDEIDRAYCAKEIGSLAAYRMLAPILRGTRQNMVDFSRETMRMDPEFPAFALFCRQQGIDLKIVSDGLDFYIEIFLQQFRLEGIPYYSNRLSFREGGSVEIDFPYSSQCGSCGTCKSGIIRRCRKDCGFVVYVGDGHSDVCPAREADLVFAKGILYDSCRRNGTPCIRYEHFGDVLDILRKTFRSRGGETPCG